MGSTRDQTVAQTIRSEQAVSSHVTSEMSRTEQSITSHMTAELRSTKEHVTSESSRAETALKSHLAHHLTAVKNSMASRMSVGLESVANQASQDARERESRKASDDRLQRLLQSLKYPAMNERRNHVSKSSTGTFKWVLDADGSASDSDNASDGDSASDYDSASNDDSASDEDITSEDDSELGFDSSFERWHPHRVSNNNRWDNLGDWLKSENDMYWISGKPGSGKSTLVKFLVDSPQARAALEIWRPRTLILSHFFWKPGSRMQNSIKGLLCSLLHQAISSGPSVVPSVFSRCTSLGQKDSHTDWSVEELNSTCLAVFTSHPLPMCVFIDGLDEICEQDGAIALMEVVDSLRAIPTVKVCVASRPEPRFSRRLQHNQHLRLQDLTFDDMRKYACEVLRPYLGTSPAASIAESGCPLPDSLAYKAEGVFLWLHLATRTLVRGLDNGDHKAELARRLAGLPSELSKLYSDMWRRLNEDTQIYHQTAAFYLNLLIDARADADFLALSRLHHKLPPYFEGTVDLFHFMVATRREVQTAFLSERGSIPPSRLNQLCVETCKAVQVRCAGLVEMVPTNSAAALTSNEHAALKPHLNTALCFIHRTAYDFLIDTEEGRNMRAYDPFPKSNRKLWLVCGLLVEATLCSRYTSEAQAVISLVQRQAHQHRQELLRVCWEWYDAGHLGADSSRWTPSYPHFLAVAGQRDELKDFVWSSVVASPNPSLLATTVLRDMFGLTHSLAMMPFASFDLPFSALGRLEAILLSLDADVRSRGFRHTPHPSHPCYVQRMETSVPYITPLGHFLQVAAWTSEIKSYGMLSRVLKSNIGPGERFPLVLRVTPNKPEPQWRSIERLPVHSLSLTYAGLNGRPREYWQLCLDVNSAFASGILCERNGKRTQGVPSFGGEASPKPFAAVALVIPPGIDQPGDLHLPAYRLLNTRAADELLADIKLWLTRGLTDDLIQKISQSLSDVARGIDSGSEDYSLLDGSMSDYLAKIGCGYRFVDEEYNRAESRGGSKSSAGHDGERVAPDKRDASGVDPEPGRCT